MLTMGMLSKALSKRDLPQQRCCYISDVLLNETHTYLNLNTLIVCIIFVVRPNPNMDEIE
jgi:hypothetical protein